MPRGNARKHAAGADDQTHREPTMLKVLQGGEPNGDSNNASDRRPQASEELEAALRETGDAVNVIIDQAEKVLDYDGGSARAYRATVQSAMLRILEVCAFEDLTGQRIAKVVDVLRDMEDVTGQNHTPLAAARAAKRSQACSALDGPAINAPHMSQADIDAVFAE